MVVVCSQLNAGVRLPTTSGEARAVNDLVAVESDFDAIAAALAQHSASERLTASERVLLNALPNDACVGLDVGCGHGTLTRAAARRGLSMWGLDLSAQMIRLAAERTPPELPVRYVVGEVLTTEVSPAQFDVVLCVNMVHHLPLEAVIPRLQQWVAPGGSLLLQDILERPGLRYLPLNLLAGATRLLDQMAGHDPLGVEARHLYEAHGAGERYLTPPAVRAAYAVLLPGARIIYHLQWRYSVIWTRPAAT